MLRRIIIVTLGWAVGLLLVVQDAYPWPVTPERLTRGRAPLALSGSWETRLVRLEGLVSGKLFEPVWGSDLSGRLLLVVGEGENPEGVWVHVSIPEIPDISKSGEPMKCVGRVTREPVLPLEGLGLAGASEPGMYCVDATAPRFTWRSLAGLVAILWGAWILVRAIRRERARKRAAAKAAFPGAESDAQPS